MNLNWRTRLLTVITLSILCFPLAACQAQIERPDDDHIDDTTAAPEQILPDHVIVGGEEIYKLIRPENGTDEEVRSSQLLRERVLSVTGVDLGLSDDWYRAEEDIYPLEILVGTTNRAETRAAMELLHYHDFIIRLDGGKLVLLGATPEQTTRAVEYFLEHCVSETGIVLPADFCYHEKGAYAAEDLLIGDVQIESYTILYATKDVLPYAEEFRRVIGEYCGANLPIEKLKDGETREHVIVFGSSALREMEAADFYAYHIETEGNRIFFRADDEYAYDNAFLAFTDGLTRAGGKVEDVSALACSYTLPDRAAYLQDPSLLYMRWAAEWETPEWMLDYSAKKEALFGGNGTEDLWVNAHRADHTYYPENSLEAIISCYYMGVSIVELDLRVTLDGVIVLMHDETLTRMTDAARYIGKAGYPDSNKVSDWTYSQLQTLYLKEGQGGSAADLTKFKIPTLEEALIVCRDRMFIVPDKTDYWQYIDSVNYMKASEPNYLFDAMKKADNYTSILISYGITNAGQAVGTQNAIETASGVKPYILLRGTNDASAGNYNILSAKAPGTFALMLGGNYNAELDYAKATAANRDKCTYSAWTIGTGDSANDFEENWKTLFDQHVRLIMTNDPLGMVRFAAELRNSRAGG